MEKNYKDIVDGINKVAEDVLDVINIVQVFRISLHDNKEDQHIIRTVEVIEKMLQKISSSDMAKLIENSNNLINI